MLKIRLSRTGKRNDVSFRIVVTEHTKPVKSGFIEHIGFYNPQSKTFQIDKDKLDAWMKKGATPSTTVNNLLVREKIFAKDKLVKVTRVPKKKGEESAKGGSASGGKKEEEDLPAGKAGKEEKKAEDKTKAKEEKTEAKNEEVKEEAAERPLGGEAKTEKKKPEVDKK